MGNDIPTSKRLRVQAREQFRCLRCGGQGAEWHHRRSKSVRDDHRHCTCNGVWLCNTCHRWAHAHPFEARGLGLIVSRYVPVPSTEPTLCVVRGWITLKCDGEVEFTSDPREVS